MVEDLKEDKKHRQERTMKTVRSGSGVVHSHSAGTTVGFRGVVQGEEPPADKSKVTIATTTRALTKGHKAELQRCVDHRRELDPWTPGPLDPGLKQPDSVPGHRGTRTLLDQQNQNVPEGLQHVGLDHLWTRMDLDHLSSTAASSFSIL